MQVRCDDRRTKFAACPTLQARKSKKSVILKESKSLAGIIPITYLGIGKLNMVFF